MLNRVTSMLDTRFQDRVLVTQPSRRMTDLTPELSEIVTTPVAQFDALEVAPDSLDRVDVGGIARQGFEIEALGSLRGQEALDHLAAMNRGAIPDHQELSREVAQEVTEKADHVGSLEGAGQDVLEHPTTRRQAADRREVVVGQRNAQERGVPFGGIGPDPGGEQVETRFVDPDDGASLVLRFFSSAGQRSVSQASTLAGSRWVARTSGCWTLRPRVRTRRLTCDG